MFVATPPPNSSVETLMLTVMVLGDGAFGMELGHEDTALTRSLVESCGLELRGPGHPVTRDPEVVLQLSVLYASLAGLQLLAGAAELSAVHADAGQKTFRGTVAGDPRPA